MEATPRAVVDVDPALLARALHEQVDRVADTVLRSDLQRPVPGMAWTAGQVAAHLSVVHTAFAGAIRGDDQSAVEAIVGTTGTLPERLRETNDRALALTDTASPREAADRLRALGHTLGDEVAALSRDQDRVCWAPWYGVPRLATTLACLALAETLVHGQDLQRAAGRPRPLDRAGAALAAATVMSQMLPLLVDRQAAAGISALLRVNVVNGGSFDLLLAGGAAQSLPPGSGTPDCVVRVTPDAALLIGFARIEVARAVLTGRAASYGRAPWIALRFGSLFLHP